MHARFLFPFFPFNNAFDCVCAFSTPGSYYLLASCFWTRTKASTDIYLLEKEKHPRYRVPGTFEIAREFPDWFIGALANALKG